MREGLVIQHGANRYLVEEGGAGGTVWACTLRGRLRQGRRRGVRLVVIGDRVRFSPAQPAASTAGVIEEVLPRRNAISRPTTGDRARRSLEQVVVANLDRLWVTASLAEPPLNLRFVDRILAAAAHQEVPAGVLLNKADLADAADPRPLQHLYESLGTPVLVCSALSGEGIIELRRRLQGAVSALVGLSGVGKSSLLAAVQPGLEVAVRSVGARSRHGRHTTSVSRLYPLAGGGYLADTPGMRAFGLWGMEPGDLSAAFVEVARRSDGCRFRDCVHRDEPDCAVRAAVEDGSIDAGRYASYLALLLELEEGADDAPRS